MIECEICRIFNAASLGEHTSNFMVVLGAAHRAFPGYETCVGERSIVRLKQTIFLSYSFLSPHLGFCTCHYRD